jgi:hypothetical protein
VQPASLIPAYHRIRIVRSFAELAAARFTDGVNALCWPRVLAGDFGEIVRLLGQTDTIDVIDEDRLRSFSLSADGFLAVKALCEDLRLLREQARDPVLNLIHGYPRDEDAGPVATDVFSWHADSAPVEADTWLCTYHGSPSEGLRNEDAVRRADVPATRAELLKLYGGADDAGFRDFLHEHCYDLHYAARPGAAPYSFGLFNLWRITIDHPGNRPPFSEEPDLRSPSAVIRASPPCIHRAPATIPGQPRLMVIC